MNIPRFPSEQDETTTLTTRGIAVPSGSFTTFPLTVTDCVLLALSQTKQFE